MENYSPSAPPIIPSNYHSFLMSNSHQNQRDVVDSFYSSLGPNIDCLICKKKLYSNEKPSFVINPCGHVYHTQCGLTFLIRGNGREPCPECNGKGNYIKKVVLPQNLYNQGDSSEDEGIPIDCGNNPTIRRHLEKSFGKQGEISGNNTLEHDENYWHEIYGDETDLTLIQKNKLTYTKNPLKIYKAQFDFQYLFDEGAKIKHLLSLNINILAMYFKLGIQEWDQLTALNLKKTHLLDKKNQRLIPLEPLIDLYKITFKNLTVDLDFTLNDLILLNVDFQDMKNLGIDFGTLISEGITKKMMLNFKFTFNQWRSLGFTKIHLMELAFQPSDYITLKWNPIIVADELGILHTHEKDELGITPVLLQNYADKLNRKTNKTQKMRTTSKNTHSKATKKKPVPTSRQKPPKLLSLDGR